MSILTVHQHNEPTTEHHEKSPAYHHEAADRHAKTVKMQTAKHFTKSQSVQAKQTNCSQVTNVAMLVAQPLAAGKTFEDDTRRVVKNVVNKVPAAMLGVWGTKVIATAFGETSTDWITMFGAVLGDPMAKPVAHGGLYLRSLVALSIPLVGCRVHLAAG